MHCKTVKPHLQGQGLLWGFYSCEEGGEAGISVTNPSYYSNDRADDGRIVIQQEGMKIVQPDRAGTTVLHVEC